MSAPWDLTAARAHAFGPAHDAAAVRAWAQLVAARIDGRWTRAGRAEAAFDDIAHDVLVRTPTTGIGFCRGLAHLVFSDGSSSAAEGDGIVVELYAADGIHIEAELWFEQTTELVERHDTGVLAVVEGRIARAQWRFADVAREHADVRLGELSWAGAEVLTPGDLRSIVRTAPLACQCMTLDAAAATVLVRTTARQPEWTILPPGVAYVRRPPTPRERLRYRALAEVPRRFAPFAIETCLDVAIRESPLAASIELLARAAALGVPSAMLADLCESGRTVHGDVMLRIEAAITRVHERHSLLGVRTDVNPEQRLALFLLMLVPDRACMRALLGQLYPEHAIDEILWGWLGQLRDPLALSEDPVSEILLRGLFDGCDEDALLARVAAVFDAEDVERGRADILAIARRIRTRPALRRVLGDAPTLGTEVSQDWVAEIGARPSGATALPESTEFAVNPEHVVQTTSDVPPQIATTLGFALRLAPHGPTAWVRDPGSGMWAPYRAAPREAARFDSLWASGPRAWDFDASEIAMLREAGILLAPGDRERRSEQWRREVEVAREHYRSFGYARLPRWLNRPQLQGLGRHLEGLARAGAFHREHRYLGHLGIHFEVATRFWQHQLVPIISSIVDEEVRPTLCYVRIYGERAELLRHTDRPGCTWNVSIAYDVTSPPDAPLWPLWLRGAAGDVAIGLEPGEAVLYRGTAVEHWREPQPSASTSIFGFAMFAPRDHAGTVY